ncbi:bifunctional diguanylate cyclase/phosphodiesterase [Gallaecimonas kandeliae]|uniref:bifunctional diguanylate cyclase/phosphodiesterase n=1 Tax=Gallaecimonas kandeliae TaxID=3029055 RepID=UPI0026494735|nr:bifunctional diguanylate cyclase/phosphodiesterase [Gallaecimonas kandeliae]WKE66477.1 bifunctional diguanylate cyclase/phosphodiesterase [Gallaecimonas kandeliae]
MLFSPSLVELGTSGLLGGACLCWWQGHRRIKALEGQLLKERRQSQLLEQLASQGRSGWLCLTPELDVASYSRSLADLLPKLEDVRGRHVSLLELPLQLGALRQWRDGKSPYFEQQIPGFQLHGYRKDGQLWLHVQCQQGQQRQLKELRRQLQLDGVTGLLNRQGFILKLASEGLADGALAQLNLRRFRLLNDNLGHDAGDSLLSRLGELVKGALHHGEFAARPDGDTFWVRFCGDDWAPRLEALLRVLESAVGQINRDGYPLAVKAGVCVGEPDLEIWECLRRADLACHLPSELPWVKFSADHPVLVERHQASVWARKVSQAINNDDFLLFYQPLKALKPQHGPLRVEVLVRMLGDQGEMLSPGRFLAATEHFQLTNRLDHWVLKAVIDWLSRHPDLHDQLVLAVNLSGQSLSDCRFALQIRDWLRAAGVPAKTLCIEITESVAIDSLKEARRFMEALQQEGVRFALDDFGSGFSSFRYLQVLPVDYVKIDGSLVRDLLNSPRDRAIVRGIAAVCRGLSLPVVAEFVDSPTLLNYVRRLGLDYAQGNLIGRPSRLDLLPLEWPEQQEA